MYHIAGNFVDRNLWILEKFFRINTCDTLFCEDTFSCVPYVYVLTRITRIAACAECVHFRVEAMMGGYHAHKDIRDSTIGKLLCQTEQGNAKGVSAVVVLKAEAIVGHVLQKIPTASTMFLRWGGTIFCQATDRVQAPFGGFTTRWLENSLQFGLHWKFWRYCSGRKTCYRCPPSNC